MSAPRTCKHCGLWIPREHPFIFCSSVCSLDYWQNKNGANGKRAIEDYKEIPNHVTASELLKEYNG